MRKALLILSVAAALGGCANVSSMQDNTLKELNSQYRFGYAIRWQGPADSEPVQVFDDGHRTWFQFKTGATLPAIFVRSPGGMRAMQGSMKGWYVVVDGLSPEWALSVNGASGAVVNANVAARVPDMPPSADSAPSSVAMAAAPTQTNTQPPFSTDEPNTDVRDLTAEIQTLTKRVQADTKAVQDAQKKGTTRIAQSQDVQDWQINIPFDTNTPTLSQTGAFLLIQAQALENTAATIELTGVSTGAGEKDKNGALAHSRALSVKQALVNSGINPDKIKVLSEMTTGEFPHVIMVLTVPSIATALGE